MTAACWVAHVLADPAVAARVRLVPVAGSRTEVLPFFIAFCGEIRLEKSQKRHRLFLLDLSSVIRGLRVAVAAWGSFGRFAACGGLKLTTRTRNE
jgi:hypothetical protein